MAKRESGIHYMGQYGAVKVTPSSGDNVVRTTSEGVSQIVDAKKDVPTGKETN